MSTEPTTPAIADVWPNEELEKRIRSASRSKGGMGSIMADKLLARVRELQRDRQRLLKELESLLAFKKWTHAYLDSKGVPHHPPGSHGAEGCRIGDRMDWIWAEKERVREEVLTIAHDIFTLGLEFQDIRAFNTCIHRLHKAVGDA